MPTLNLLNTKFKKSSSSMAGNADISEKPNRSLYNVECLDLKNLNKNSNNNSNLNNQYYILTRSPTLAMYSFYSDYSLKSNTSSNSSSSNSSDNCNSESEDFVKFNDVKIEPRFKFNTLFKTKSSNNITLLKKLSSSSLISKNRNKPNTDNNNKDLVQIIKKSKNNAPLTRKYKLTDVKLGSGIAGTVYLVIRKSDNRKFAAKIFNKKNTNSNNSIASNNDRFYWERIANEVYITSILHNENCLEILDLANYKGHIVQITEYYPKDLVDVIEDNIMSVSKKSTIHKDLAKKYFYELIKGLHYLHTYGIGHRDIKLENLCISQDNKLKIIDFGCAKIFKAGINTYLIKSNNLYGSGPYHAPELFDVKNRDITKSDIWSAGIVFITLVTNALPWQYSHFQDSNYRNFEQDRHTYLQDLFETDFGANVVDLMLNIMDPNPDTRFSTDQILMHKAFVQINKSI